MSGVTTYRVSPHDGMWKIELAGDSITEWSSSKAEAIARARVLAGRSSPGAVVVVDADGKIETQIDVFEPKRTP